MATDKSLNAFICNSNSTSWIVFHCLTGPSNKTPSPLPPPLRHSAGLGLNVACVPSTFTFLSHYEATTHQGISFQCLESQFITIYSVPIEYHSRVNTIHETLHFLTVSPQSVNSFYLHMQSHSLSIWELLIGENSNMRRNTATHSKSAQPVYWERCSIELTSRFCS